MYSNVERSQRVASPKFPLHDSTLLYMTLYITLHYSTLNCAGYPLHCTAFPIQHSYIFIAMILTVQTTVHTTVNTTVHTNSTYNITCNLTSYITDNIIHNMTCNSKLLTDPKPKVKRSAPPCLFLRAQMTFCRHNLKHILISGDQQCPTLHIHSTHL